MKEVKFVIVSVLLGICTTAHAQYDDYDYYGSQSSYSSSYSSFGGYDDEGWSDFYIEYSPMNLVSSERGIDDKCFNAFTIGYRYAYRLGYSPVHLDVGFETTGAYFSRRYDRNEKYCLDLYFSKIPVNLSVRWDLSDYFAIVPYAGANIRWNISATEKEKYHGETYTYNLFDEEDMGDDDYNRFQIGYQAGLKLLIGQCFSIGAAYKGDLTPFYSDGDIKEKFQGIAFHIGYCF